MHPLDRRWCSVLLVKKLRIVSSTGVLSQIWGKKNVGESVLTPTPFVLLVPIHTSSHNSVGQMDYWIGTTKQELNKSEAT